MCRITNVLKFIVNRQSKMNNSSSSSSSNGLSFILHDSSDEERILKYVFDNDNDKRALEVITKLTQVTQEMMASSSSRARRRQRKKRSFIKRNREEAQERLFKDYFVEDSVYNDTHFRRRFRMRRHLFLRIIHGLQSRFEFF